MAPTLIVPGCASFERLVNVPQQSHTNLVLEIESKMTRGLQQTHKEDEGLFMQCMGAGHNHGLTTCLLLFTQEPAKQNSGEEGSDMQDKANPFCPVICLPMGGGEGGGGGGWPPFEPAHPRAQKIFL